MAKGKKKADVWPVAKLIKATPKPKRKYTKRLKEPPVFTEPVAPKAHASIEWEPKVPALLAPPPQSAKYATTLGTAYLAKVNDLLTRLRYLGLNHEAEAVASIVHDLQDALSARAPF